MPAGSLVDPGSVAGARDAGAVRAEAAERAACLKLGRKIGLDQFAPARRSACCPRAGMAQRFRAFARA